MTLLGKAKIDLVRYVDPAGVRKTEVLTRNTALKLMLELGEQRRRPRKVSMRVRAGKGWVWARVRVIRLVTGARQGVSWWARMRNTIMEVV